MGKKREIKTISEDARKALDKLFEEYEIFRNGIGKTNKNNLSFFPENESDATTSSFQHDYKEFYSKNKSLVYGRLVADIYAIVEDALCEIYEVCTGNKYNSRHKPKGMSTLRDLQRKLSPYVSYKGLDLTTYIRINQLRLVRNDVGHKGDKMKFKKSMKKHKLDRKMREQFLIFLYAADIYINNIKPIKAA